MLPRIGNIQAVLEVQGSGLHEQILVRLSKIVPPGSPPERTHLYDLGEIALLRQLCDNILNDSFNRQTLMLPNGRLPNMPETKREER
jgi:hypothetical protein